MSGRAARFLVPCVVVLLILLGSPAGRAGEVQKRVLSSGELKVCIWPAYQGITWRDPRSGQLSGLDIDLARALAADLQLKLRFVDSSFPDLVQDLQSNRCDVAMFGIAMLPARQEKLLFSVPYLQSDIHAITTRASRVVRHWGDIDKPGVMVGVQAGTFMEPIMRQRLRRATLVSIQLPQTRERELMAGRVDVFMTDFPYGHALVENTDWALLLSSPQPFHILPYAYASKRGDTEWRDVLNAFVARVQRDGRLLQAARRQGIDNMVLQ